MSRAVRCDILIPYAGSPAVLAHCLASVRRSLDRSKDRVWVGIDEPRHVPAARQLCDEHGVECLVNDEPAGYRATVDRLASLGDARRVAFLNCDTVVPPGWLDRLLGELEADGQLGLVSARILSARHGRLDYCGMAFGHGTCIPLWHRGLTQHPLSLVDQDFQAVPDCCAVTSRSIMERFPRDAAFPVAWGDIDFSLSLTHAGLRNLCVGDVAVWHMRHTAGPRRMANVDLARAHLFAKWSGIMRRDLPHWLARSYREGAVRADLQLPRQARLVDLLEPYDDDAYLEAIAHGLGIDVVERARPGLVLGGPAYLPALIPPEDHESAMPLVLLVKHVDMLAENALSRRQHSGRSDLVLDAHGNVEPLGRPGSTA